MTTQLLAHRTPRSLPLYLTQAPNVDHGDGTLTLIDPEGDPLKVGDLVRIKIASGSLKRVYRVESVSTHEMSTIVNGAHVTRDAQTARVRFVPPKERP